MPDDVLEVGLDALARGRGLFEKAVADLTPAEVLVPPVPGGNPAVWLLGHVAWVDSAFCGGIGGSTTVPAAWTPLFGKGSTPAADPAAYPPLAEVLATWRSSRDSLVALFRSLPAEKLSAAPTGFLAKFGRSFAAIAGSIAGHEMLHYGQLSVVRKVLGKPPVIG